VFWNPAGLGLVNSYYVSGMAMNHLYYWQYYNLTSSILLGKKAGGLGIGLAYLTATDVEYDEQGTSGSEFRNSDMLLNVGYGKTLGKKRQISFGASGKVVRSQLYNVSAYGVLGDVGFILSPVSNLYLGTVMKNLGNPRRFIEKWEYPPVNFRQGVAYKLPFRQNYLALSLDYSVYPDYPATLSVGAELRIREPDFLKSATKAVLGQEAQISGFSLMAGYQSGYQGLGWSGLSFGFALEIMIFQGLYLDIGAVVLSYGYLGTSERIGLGLNFVPTAKGARK
jgi:hypothetical protein